MDTFTVEQADNLAHSAHEGVLDDNGVPYIEHPRRVAARLDDPVLKMIALLHDVIEDTDWTAEMLRTAGVPERVVVAVETLTHPHGERNDVYWARVRENEDARRVKLADVADNTDPARMAQLDPAVRERRTRKYTRAVIALRGDPMTCLPG
jgi:(p)ppGpp synthase/HD superfamily hydrolase